jgi:hypothetical protein
LDKEAEAAFNHVEDPTLVEYERVYRLRHEGHSTLDKLPFYKEFVEFKNNWMAIKSCCGARKMKPIHPRVFSLRAIYQPNIFQSRLV